MSPIILLLLAFFGSSLGKRLNTLEKRLSLHEKMHAFSSPTIGLECEFGNVVIYTYSTVSAPDSLLIQAALGAGGLAATAVAKNGAAAAAVVAAPVPAAMTDGMNLYTNSAKSDVAGVPSLRLLADNCAAPAGGVAGPHSCTLELAVGAFTLDHTSTKHDRVQTMLADFALSILEVQTPAVNTHVGPGPAPGWNAYATAGIAPNRAIDDSSFVLGLSQIPAAYADNREYTRRLSDLIAHFNAKMTARGPAFANFILNAVPAAHNGLGYFVRMTDINNVRNGVQVNFGLALSTVGTAAFRNSLELGGYGAGDHIPPQRRYDVVVRAVDKFLMSSKKTFNALSSLPMDADRANLRAALIIFCLQYTIHAASQVAPVFDAAREKNMFNLLVKARPRALADALEKASNKAIHTLGQNIIKNNLHDELRALLVAEFTPHIVGAMVRDNAVITGGLAGFTACFEGNFRKGSTPSQGCAAHAPDTNFLAIQAPPSKGADFGVVVEARGGTIDTDFSPNPNPAGAGVPTLSTVVTVVNGVGGALERMRHLLTQSPPAAY